VAELELEGDTDAVEEADTVTLPVAANDGVGLAVGDLDRVTEAERVPLRLNDGVGDRVRVTETVPE
jgi:hypothetical protein